MAVLVNTLSVPPADRFDLWAQATSKIFFPLDIKPLHGGPFYGRVDGHMLGPIEVYRVTGDPNLCARTARGIRQGDPEHLQLYIQRRGHSQVAQQDRKGVTAPGDVMTQDSSQPYTIRANEQFDLRVFDFPKPLLGPHLKRLSERTALRLPGGSGLASRVAPFLSGLVDGLDDGSVPDNDLALADSLFGLLRALYSDSTDPTVNSGNQLSAGLLSRIKAFIEAHLHEEDLGPDRIAAAHFISTRYLHKLFEAEEMSVSRWVQQRRLERCRRDLGDPELAMRTIESISSRWGFVNPDHFSRLFRAAYGCSPRELRWRILQAKEKHSEELIARGTLLD